MTTQLTINTGRPYTRQGQIITLVLMPDQRVLFYDHTRGIDGATIGAFKAPFEPSPDLLHWFLAQYDDPRGHESAWEYSPEAHSLAHQLQTAPAPAVTPIKYSR